LNILENLIIDGDMTIGIIASVSNWTSGADSMLIFDNETTDPIIVLPSFVREGDGVLTNKGGVFLQGTVTNDTVFNLISDDTSELVVPGSVTIPAGQASAPFHLDVRDDPAQDGSVTVTVTATASGFIPGMNTTIVLDDDADFFVILPIGTTQVVNQPFPASMEARRSDGALNVAFNGNATLTGVGNGGPAVPLPSLLTFSNGIWTGTLTFAALNEHVQLTVDDGMGHIGLSNPFDIVPRPLEPFLPVEPLGSLTYRAIATSVFASVTSTDQFSIAINPGQKISLLVEPDSNLRPELTIYQTGGVLTNLAASAPGETVYFNALSLPSGGVYRIQIQDLAGATGLYQIAAWLNGSLEPESFAGAPNDTLATAFDLDPSFITPTPRFDRASVFGRVGEPIFFDGFESGSLGPPWSTFAICGVRWRW
ncbi:MAG: hypothetical protein AAF492_26385, partial [Verrucomicrobiota bacterium]